MVEQHKGPMLERAQQQAAAAAAAAASKEAAEAEAEAKRRRRGGSGRGFAPSSVWAKEAEFAAQCKGWEGGEKGEEMAVQQGVAPPPAPGPAGAWVGVWVGACLWDCGLLMVVVMWRRTQPNTPQQNTRTHIKRRKPELGAALAGLVVSYLEEASPDAFDEVRERVCVCFYAQ